MSTCHQAHNIPWGELLSVLGKTPTRSTWYFQRFNNYSVQDLRFQAEEKVLNKLQFFARKFEASIQEFSKTERLKYNNSDLDKMTELFDSDTCIENEWLSEKLQNVSEWDAYKSNGTHDRILEALKELFIQEKAGALLCLARRGFPLETYQHVTYSNFFHYGIGRIKEDSLTLYIHLNLLLATNTICEPDKWYGQWTLFLDREIMTEYDGNSHARMYKDYFENNPKFEDLEGMQNLLKKLHRTMYIYDMVMAERGIKVNWEAEVLSCLGYFRDGTKVNRQLYWDLLQRVRQ